MDKIEALAQQHLKQRFPGSGRVLYEPDGNVTPDFLVDGQIAVEVRRLNEHFGGDDSLRGLEEDAVPLVERLRSLIASLDGSHQGTRILSCHFGRPVPPWPEVENGVRAFIECLDRPTSMSVAVACNVYLSWHGQVTDLGTPYHLGAWTDDNQGGMLLQVFERNLRHCIADKTVGLRRERHRYPEWWLLLIDLVEYGLAVSDEAALRESFEWKHEWDKVVIVSPVDPTRAFEL